VIVNDRTDAPADFRSREGDNAMGSFDNKHPWELSTTITDGAWGYQPDAKVKSFDQLIHLLIGAVGRDGNLLLNVGPQPDGEIDPRQVLRLREIGDWLHAHGESIYDTRGGPYLPREYGVSTYRAKTIYIHLLADLSGKRLRLPPLAAKVLSCKVLTGGSATCSQSVAGVDITLAANPEVSSSTDTIVALNLSSAASLISPISTMNGASNIAPIAAPQ
jgi:alpha-L-fucosidase